MKNVRIVKEIIIKDVRNLIRFKKEIDDNNKLKL